MTRIAVIGAGGMLGTDLMSVLAPSGPTGFTKSELDITDAVAVTEALVGFDVVVNAAAYTKVDDAESHSDLAFAVNARGPLNIARACATHGQRLIHVSTDYVFHGTATTPYAEDHPANPQSVYGASKAEGENNVRTVLPESSVIVRTAWLYGHGGPNFVATMLKLAESRDTVSVVTDQIGQPTWSHDLAGMIASLIDSPVRSGIFHGTSAGQASWYDFAQTIFEAAGLDPQRVLPTTSESFLRPAPRPAWSVLGHDEWGRHGLPEPRHWREAFQDAWDSVLRDSYDMPDPGSTP
jgi:dTDP-4-dehydrorhamnose reductase